MTYIGEPELREKAAKFIVELREGGMQAAIVETAFRDWQAKVSILFNGTALGNAVLYYKKNGNFTLGLQELKDKQFSTQIEMYWQGNSNPPPMMTPPIPESINTSQANQLVAYVDGSYQDGKTGYGAVIIDGIKEVARFSGIVEEADGTRQVAGELQATMSVLTWCLDQKLAEIEIHYDYEGIEKWASGAWRAKQPLTQAYVSFLRQCPVKIQWSKVKSHSGDRWNDIADQLAKQGTQLSPQNTTKISSLAENNDTLSEVEYYYQYLTPYRDHAFDFITLATALQQQFTPLDSSVDVIIYRYDFNYLEQLYLRLKESLRQ